MAMESEACYLNDMDKATELRLGLPGTDAPTTGKGTKRARPDDDEELLGNGKCSSAGGDESTGRGHESAPPAKQQVVGWPPIRSYRKNNIRAKKDDQVEAAGGLLVKVSMDGAPYLRKIDLKVYKGYKELREALDVMFKCFSQGSGNYTERCNMDFAMTYEDKDGDWMLVGDVPWEMFTSSCKRLRIMKGSEARGHGTTGR